MARLRATTSAASLAGAAGSKAAGMNRRAVRALLTVLVGRWLVGWIVGYVWISGMACAFSGPGAGSCTIPLPWQLRGEDMWLMVIAPALVLLMLGALIRLVRPQNSDS